MQKDESPLPPPVPPRRKRCKTQPKRPSTTYIHATKTERKHRAAPPLPPPAPPQRTRGSRKTSSPFPNEDSSPVLAKSFNSLEYGPENHDETSRNSIADKSECINVNTHDFSLESSQTLEATNLHPEMPKRSRSPSPFSKPPEPDKYPPLYFTFQDYQTVMESSINLKGKQLSQERKISFNEEQIEAYSEEKKRKYESREEKSQNIYEKSEAEDSFNAESDTRANGKEDAYFHISTTDQPCEIDENFESIFAPFMEDITFSNPREEIYFRVTTTNRPFEKCQSNWNKSFDEPKKFEEVETNDLYIFEDYMDRSNRLNARPHLLFNEDLFSIPQDDNSASTERSTTRVRFIIESPSTSTPDLDLDDDGTSYGEFVEKQFENYQKSTVELIEVTDEELQDFEKDLTSPTMEEERENELENKFESETAEDENISESLCVLTSNQINDYSYSDWEEDVEVSSVSANVENEPKECANIEEITEESNQEEVMDEVSVEDKDVIVSEPCQEKVIDENPAETVCGRRKIFIDSSHYNLSTDNNIWRSCSEDDRDDTLPDENFEPSLPEITEEIKSCNDVIENGRQEQNVVQNFTENTEEYDKNIVSAEIKASATEEKSVPVNVRRNSFLETMLSNNTSSQNSWGTATVNCEVIAAHPKQDLSTPASQQSTKQPDVATESEAAPRSSSGIKLTEPGSRPKARDRINAASSNNKSAGDVKCDVLNELLTNFSAIKLKPVNKSTRESVRSEDRSEQKAEATKPIEAKTDDIHQISEAQDAVETNCHANCKEEADITLPAVNSNSPIMNSSITLPAIGSNSPMMNSSITLPEVNSNSSSKMTEQKRDSIVPSDENTSAIINEASYVQRNDNDNKTTTPVVVSKDQFREAVSITPGSVRSFVKYYEIHSEISSIAKIRDNAFKKKSELAQEKEKKKLAKAGEKSNKKMAKNSSSPKTTVTTKAEILEQSSRRLSETLDSPQKIQKKSNIKSSIPSPRPERKKSVQFDSGCTVINLCKKEEKEKEEEEGTFSSFIGGIRTRLKRKAPIKPDVKKTEQPKGLKLDQRRTESAAIICIQKSPEAKSVTCTPIPGNRSFLPQPETLQNNQTIVFYCTV